MAFPTDPGPHSLPLCQNYQQTQFLGQDSQDFLFLQKKGTSRKKNGFWQFLRGPLT